MRRNGIAPASLHSFLFVMRFGRIRRLSGPTETAYFRPRRRTNLRIRPRRQALLLRGRSRAILNADQFNVRRYMGPSHFRDPFVIGAWYRVRIAFKSPLGRGGEIVPVGAVLRYTGS